MSSFELLSLAQFPLSGLPPAVIIDIASRALAFWVCRSSVSSSMRLKHCSRYINVVKKESINACSSRKHKMYVSSPRASVQHNQGTRTTESFKFGKAIQHHGSRCKSSTCAFNILLSLLKASDEIDLLTSKLSSGCFQVIPKHTLICTNSRCL